MRYHEGKNTCWNISIKYANLLTGVVTDDNVDDAWTFVCSLYGIREKDGRGIDEASHSLFCESETWLRCVASNAWCIRVLILQGKTIKLRYGFKQTIM